MTYILPHHNDMEFLDDVVAEVARARNKFPLNTSEETFAALVEEVGEVAKARLEKRPNHEVWKEAVQTAVMALRLATEFHSV